MKSLTLVFLLTFSFNTFAQTCLGNVARTAPDGDFEEVTDTEIRQISTGLVWQRCALGQTWGNNSCEGDATKFTWSQALEAAWQANDENRQGWRLPNLKELATLTERACVRPAIPTAYFPQTPSDDFWTSTPSVSDPLRAWVVAFFNASHSIKAKDRAIYVRLVRTDVAE